MQSVPPGGRSGENNMSIVVLGPQASPPARVETNQLYCNNAVCERTVTFPIRVARDAGRRGRLRSQDDDAHIFFTASVVVGVKHKLYLFCFFAKLTPASNCFSRSADRSPLSLRYLLNSADRLRGMLNDCHSVDRKCFARKTIWPM